LEAIALDRRNILIKADTENDVWEIDAFIKTHNDKINAVNDLFKLGNENCIIDNGYTFNRNELYE
jgi:hypothetical protein